MGFPLGLINKKSGVALSKKNDPILSVEAKASRMDRISALEDIDQLKGSNDKNIDTSTEESSEVDVSLDELSESETKEAEANPEDTETTNT